MPDVFDLNDQFRRALLREDREAAKTMVRAYAQSWSTIRTRLNVLLREIGEKQAAGQRVPAEWLLEAERLPALQQQVEREIARFSQFAGQSITEQQRQAVQAAQAHYEQMILTGLGDPPLGAVVAFNRLPAGAIEDLVGFLSDGSPLRALLDQLAPTASAAAREALISGLALGQNPVDIAKRLRLAMGGNLVRALRIARTETLRSYRATSHRLMEANADIVSGWTWVSAANARTCASCWAMHGSVHRLDERLDDHPNGRCVATPATRSWAELGFPGVPDTRPSIARGPDLFARLSETDQIAILGPAAQAAYQAGEVALEDFVGRHRSERWGTMRFADSLEHALARAQRRTEAA